MKNEKGVAFFLPWLQQQHLILRMLLQRILLREVKRMSVNKKIYITWTGGGGDRGSECPPSHTLYPRFLPPSILVPHCCAFSIAKYCAMMHFFPTFLSPIPTPHPLNEQFLLQMDTDCALKWFYTVKCFLQHLPCNGLIMLWCICRKGGVAQGNVSGNLPHNIECKRTGLDFIWQ